MVKHAYFGEYVMRSLTSWYSQPYFLWVIYSAHDLQLSDTTFMEILGEPDPLHDVKGLVHPKLHPPTISSANRRALGMVYCYIYFINVGQAI